MGLIGFLAVLGYRRREVLPPGFLRSIVTSIALIMALGLVAWDMVDNAAHLGGLGMGLVLGFVYIGRRAGGVRLEPSLLARFAGGASFGMLIAMSLFTLWLLLRQ